MNLLQNVISQNLTILRKEWITPVQKILPNTFIYCANLTKVAIPSSIKIIHQYAFDSCNNISEFNTDGMNEYCIVNEAFYNTAWQKSYTSNKLILGANGKIMFGNTYATPSSGLSIPDSVVNLAACACKLYGTATDSAFTSFIIPDQVEIIGRNPFSGQTTLTKITVGANVRHIDSVLSPGTNATTLTFRQPAGMEVELPKPGDGTGLAYNKSSYSVTIYTDNECIKNYGWATDNVTATFYPLADAPA